mmetsp:Transcript_4655/g.7055  ORF Transcript_4655/g.7055 Transcript_4655/m.7055 type:complete len:87 (-) Transcript_4655:115-375(-)
MLTPTFHTVDQQAALGMKKDSDSTKKDDLEELIDDDSRLGENTKQKQSNTWVNNYKKKKLMIEKEIKNILQDPSYKSKIIEKANDI